jgi:uncharacterized protein YfeS
MSKFTPGPWVIYDDGPDGSDVILAHIDEENYDIAYIAADERPEDEKKANARLIAAAPDLLSAAKNAANVLAAIATGQLVTIGKDSHALQELRHAIAKAE